MPLARVRYEKGIRDLSPNTTQRGCGSPPSATSPEGHCFCNCDMVFTRDMTPQGSHGPEEIGRLPDIVGRPGSRVVDPYSHYVTRPSGTGRPILADLDLTQVPRSRMDGRLRSLLPARRAEADGGRPVSGQMKEGISL